MRQIKRIASLLSAFFLIGVAANPVSGQSPARAPDANFRTVSMVQQDQSDCENSTVRDQYAEIGGSAFVLRGSDGTTAVKVRITAKPNTTYHFFLKCVRILGDIKTRDEGAGEAEFTFRTNEVGNVYAFHMYPEGAPRDNMYQSVQVRY
jgi:hypothetical protein